MVEGVLGAQAGVEASETGEGREEKEANLGYSLDWLPPWAYGIIMLKGLWETVWGTRLMYPSPGSREQGVHPPTSPVLIIEHMDLSLL